jgi:putative iron-regulated protein
MMKATPVIILIVVAFLRLSLFAGNGDAVSKTSVDELKRAVIANYANVAFASYQDALQSAKTLQKAVNTLLAKASEETIAEARRTWLSAHQIYSLTETFRFYDGPIDQVETLVNSWPIDASYIDSVVGAPDSGIINKAADFPAISRELVISHNAKDGELNITAGFHAIEFLLWGQPPNGRGAGNRSWHDYADGGKNVERRREYLKLVTDLLVENLQTVVAAWEDGKADNYRAKFLAKEPDAALSDILKGMGALSGPELSGERLTTAYETKERSEQQSCFSNSTCEDLIGNAIGIQNVFYGDYTSTSGAKIEGPGVFELLKKVDPALADKLSTQVSEAVNAVKNIPPPFDRAILGNNQSPSRIAMKKAIQALKTQSDMVVQAASALSIKLNL